MLKELAYLNRGERAKRREAKVGNSIRVIINDLSVLIPKIEENFKELIRENINGFIKGRVIESLFCLGKFSKIHNFNRLIDFIKEQKINCTVAKFMLIYTETYKIFKDNRNDFDSFKLHIDDKNQIYFICLSAKIGFNNILDFKPKSIILASGTLSPFEILEKQLSYEFNLKFSIEPDIDKWKKKLMVLKVQNLFEFNEFKKIRLNYKMRNNKDILKSFLTFLAHIAKFVPSGILIFLPSYSLLEDYKSIILSNS